MHIWSGTLGLAQVFQWNSRVFQCAKILSAVVDMPVSVLDQGNRHAVPVRTDCVAAFLLSQLKAGCDQHVRWETWWHAGTSLVRFSIARVPDVCDPSIAQVLLWGQVCFVGHA